MNRIIFWNFAVFGIPRRDTNPLAHQLLDTYGSFSAVLDAPFDDLVKMKGMTESAAFLLKLCTGVSRAYDIDKADHTVLLNSLAAIEKYIQPFFKGKIKRGILCILLG